MFVPLPVPFVFQRTAPDLNAWRLKSPLALRSNSGKTFFSLLPATHPPCWSGLAAQTRPTLLGAVALAVGESCAPHTQLTHAHTLLSLRLRSPLHLTVVHIKKDLWYALWSPREYNKMRKMSVC